MLSSDKSCQPFYSGGVGGGGPLTGVLDDVGVLEAVGRIGTVGAVTAAGRTLSAGAMAGVGTAGAAFRIRNATLACCPAATVTLSSTNPRLGCHARMRYRPGGTPSMLKVPFVAVCA